MSNIAAIALNKFGKRARGCCLHVFLVFNLVGSFVIDLTSINLRLRICLKFKMAVKDNLRLYTVYIYKLPGLGHIHASNENLVYRYIVTLILIFCCIISSWKANFWYTFVTLCCFVKYIQSSTLRRRRHYLKTNWSNCVWFVLAPWKRLTRCLFLGKTKHS